MMVWSEKFSVGVKRLDFQHQQLFNLVNDLALLLDAAPTSDAIADILERLTQYAGYHFKTEEQIMKKYRFPEYDFQVREHTEFKARTAKFRMDAMAGKANLSAAMLAYLENWLTNHILESDVKLRYFLIATDSYPS
jgi:hemerythrin-like metal-binding protein